MALITHGAESPLNSRIGSGILTGTRHCQVRLPHDIHPPLPMKIKRIASLMWIVLTACSGDDVTRAPTLSRVEVSVGSAPLTLGSSVIASAVGRDQNGNVIAIGPVAWSSSATHVATVDQSGTVTGVDAGVATIRATVQDKVGTASVTVQTAALNVSFNGSNRLKVGDVYPFTVTQRRSDGVIVNLPVTYSIANGPASVSATGDVRATGAGAIELRATIGSQSYTQNLTSYDWQPTSSSTSLNASLGADLPITSRLGVSVYPTLIVGCSFGSFVMIVSIPDFQIADGVLSYQIGSNPVENAMWRFGAPATPLLSHPGPPLTATSTRAFVQSIATADKFSLTFNEAMVGARTIQFRTTGMSAAIAPALALPSCQTGGVVDPKAEAP